MENWQFWLAAGAIVLAVAATLIRALVRAKGELREAAEYDLQVYKDQLADIDRDLARGTLPAEEADRLRTEVSRRLLDADRAAQAAKGGVHRGGIGIAAGVVALALLGGFLIYDRIGAPGYPDLPLAERLAMSQEAMENRPTQSEAEATAPKAEAAEGIDPAFLTLMEELRKAVADRPDDIRGLELLASNEARLGNYVAARAAMEKLVAAKADAATAEDFAALAEIMVMAAGGIVTPEAEQALIRSLSLDPKNGTARFYSGLMFAQVGRHDQTFRLWEPLLREGPPDAPWIAPIRAGIEDVAWRAGVEYTPPEAAAGPDADAVAAAADMSAEDRQAMIEGMVAQLGERLATEGGTPEEWAQLISSLAVLGRKDEAQAIYAEALAKFEGQRSSQSFLREQALNAGLTP